MEISPLILKMNSPKKKPTKNKNRSTGMSKNKLQFIPTGKAKSKNPDGFLDWIQQIGTIRLEFEIFEEILYEATFNVLPRMVEGFEKYPGPVGAVTYGKMIKHLFEQYQNLGGLGEQEIDQAGKFTLKKLLENYKRERDKFSHFRMGFSKAILKEGPEGYEARVKYRNRVHEMHYHLCQIFEALFFVSSVTFFEPGPKVKRIAHYDLEDMRINYLPKVYNLFKLPYNRSQRRTVEANFKKQVKKLKYVSKAEVNY